jgi:glycosyltransferase involved in cell wall biosynthesis
MNPLVTVAIPTYRRFGYLREAVESALRQTYDRVEVLISDDGDNPEIHEWGERMMQEDPRVRYQRNHHNLGLAANWNRLADLAQGEYIIIIGDDDHLLPDCLAMLVRGAWPDYSVAFSNHYLIDADGRRLEEKTLAHTVEYHRDALPSGRILHVEACVWSNAVPSSAALIRTSEVRRLRFKEDLNTPEIEFFLRLAQEGGQFFFVPDYLVEYRVHAGSATSAGLRSEELAHHLLQIRATPEAEIHKRRFMEPLLVNAVSRCLRRGDRLQARRFLADPYYPQPYWRHISGIVQLGCVGLPTAVGRRVYRLIQQIKWALEK